MKRYLTFLSALLLVSIFGAVTAMGQTEIAVGPKAGLNFATMTGDLADTLLGGSSPDAGYVGRGAIGAFVTIALSDEWAIQSEILWTQKAGEWEWVEVYGNVNVTTTLLTEIEYLEIPVMVKFTVPRTGKLRPFMFAGPALAIRTASSHKIEVIADTSGTKISHFDHYSDNINNAKGTVPEIIAGIGVEWKLGSNRLMFEGRYTRSIGALFDDVADFDAIPEDDAVLAHYPSGEAMDLSHSVFSVLIGFAFSL